MSSTEVNELVAASASQKEIWISWKDKIEGTDRRKEEKKASTNKIKKIHDIIFSDISRFATQTFDGGWYCRVVTKIEFKTKGDKGEEVGIKTLLDSKSSSSEYPRLRNSRVLGSQRGGGTTDCINPNPL